MALLRVGGAVVVGFICLGAWAFPSERHDARQTPPSHVLSDHRQLDVDAATRRAMLLRAHAHAPAAGGTLPPSFVECRFLSHPPSGTTPKFDCVLSDGEVVKVKYGRNSEVYAEAAATRLLTALGYPADQILLIPTVRCHGCPRHPFPAMLLLAAMHASDRFPPYGWDTGYTDFTWAAVERHYPGPAVVSGETKGWTWWEINELGPGDRAHRIELDAIRLMAVFLSHWDNKADNQRLVCPDDRCTEPLVMLQDLGSTFGASKVNLARWRSAPIWADRAQCVATMRSLPYGGATFDNVAIAEEARQTVLRELSSLSAQQVRGVFEGARFPEFYSSTSDERDLDAWTAAFRDRVNEIRKGGPCLDRPARGPALTS